MKGVVLAAGQGSRINEVTKGGSKCLLKVGEMSIVSQNVARLCELEEITECIVVVGYNADGLMKDIGEECNNKHITYCVQKEQKGLINALEAAINVIGNDDFFMVLGDEYLINDNYAEALRIFYNKKYDCLIGIIKAENSEEVKKTYTFKFDNKGKMYSFVEKPAFPFNDFKGTGNVIFKNHVLGLLNDVPVNSKRGEKELVDLFNLMLEKKQDIASFIVAEKYFNVNTADDYDLIIKNG